MNKIITYGACFCANNLRENVWVNKLQKEFDKNGSGYEIMIRGLGAQNSRWGLKNISNVVGEEPKLVILEFGGTDAKNSDGVPFEESKKNINKLIDILEYNNIDILLLTTLPIITKGRDKSLDIYFNMYKEVASNREVDIIDFYSLFKELEISDPNTFDLALTDDKGHITKYGAVNCILPQFKKYFKI